MLDLAASVLLRERPAEVDAAARALGPPPSPAGLLRADQDRFDPGGRCAPGRLGHGSARSRHRRGRDRSHDPARLADRPRGPAACTSDHPLGRPATGIFDRHHPPADELIDDCVHCGFCLPTCPTYALWGEEMDSPRGRIYLMKMGKEGAVPLDDTYVRHFDACLGCMACVTACPSGVKYDKLIEAVRPQIERNYRAGRATARSAG